MSSDLLILVQEQYLESLAGELRDAGQRITKLADASASLAFIDSLHLAAAYQRFVGSWSEKRTQIASWLDESARSVEAALDQFQTADAEIAQKIRSEGS